MYKQPSTIATRLKSVNDIVLNPNSNITRKELRSLYKDVFLHEWYRAKTIRIGRKADAYYDNASETLSVLRFRIEMKDL